MSDERSNVGEEFTSNLSRLQIQTERLTSIRDGTPTSPVMMHLSLTNNCNLNCGYCCYGNRESGEELDFDRATSAIKQFSRLGTKGLEITGGGEPTLYGRLEEIIGVAKDEGMDVGLITNGLALGNHNNIYKDLQWMRFSLHAVSRGGSAVQKLKTNIWKAKGSNPDMDVGAVFICDYNWRDTLKLVANISNELELPTRVTPDLTKSKAYVDTMFEELRKELPRAWGSHLFLSDFNVQTSRSHEHCYMRLFKPFVYTDGFVYDCPAIGLSPDNERGMNDKFRVCTIEDITETYSEPSRSRELDCSFCKYSQQNEYLHELTKPFKHKNFM